MQEKVVLCFGDSMSWGIIPGSRGRHPYAKRWPGMLQGLLGPQVRVIEECLNGRTTAWNDPFRPGRLGQEALLPLLQSHAPLDLVIVFLGTNDLQAMYGVSAFESSLGAAVLVDMIQTGRMEPMTSSPKVLLVAPPLIVQPCGSMQERFRGAQVKSEGFAANYKRVAQERSCHFFDAARVMVPSTVDGVHLDEIQHHQFAHAVRPVVADILELRRS